MICRKQESAFTMIELIAVKLLRRRNKGGTYKEVKVQEKEYLKSLFITLFCREIQDHMDSKESRVMLALM